MKHWKRFLGTIVAVLTAVIWINVYEPETGPTPQQRADYFSQVLDGVSQDWSTASLEQLMHPTVFESNSSAYAEKFQNLQALGRFLGCPQLQLGDFAEDALEQPPFNQLDVDAAYQGNGRCVFGNGEADVLVGYVIQDEQPRLVLVKVDDVALNPPEG